MSTDFSTCLLTHSLPGSTVLPDVPPMLADNVEVFAINVDSIADALPSQPPIEAPSPPELVVQPMKVELADPANRSDWPTHRLDLVSHPTLMSFI